MTSGTGSSAASVDEAIALVGESPRDPGRGERAWPRSSPARSRARPSAATEHQARDHGGHDRQLLTPLARRGAGHVDEREQQACTGQPALRVDGRERRQEGDETFFDPQIDRRQPARRRARGPRARGAAGRARRPRATGWHRTPGRSPMTAVAPVTSAPTTSRRRENIEHRTGQSRRGQHVHERLGPHGRGDTESRALRAGRATTSACRTPRRRAR